MKNKIITCFWVIIIGGLCMLTSCKDMFEIDSPAYLDADKHYLNSANDSVYSVIGILKQLQPLGERYVVLGDLRGDLMEVTENADMNLQEIANFTATADNPYLSTREYYAVINNCNYFLQRADTSIISGGKKALLGEYAAVKAIRAWTYLQLVLNHGKAVYLTEPILTVEDMNRDYPEMTPQQLIETVLSDLENYLDETIYPSYGSNLYNDMFISGAVLAGDLYLWMGAFTGNTRYYEQAATLYYQIINNKGYRGGGNYINRYAGRNFEELLSGYAWDAVFYETQELISSINYTLNSEETLEYPSIMLLTWPEVTGRAFQYKLKPSQAAMDLWENESYIHYNSATREAFYTKGDLRGLYQRNGIIAGSCYYADDDKTLCITKYGYYTVYNNFMIINYRSFIPLYRAGKLYLRYAEALNALGKPSLAFAVLKHGLKGEVLANPEIIAEDEIRPDIPAYCDFTAVRYSEGGSMFQTGIHSRGSGYVESDTLYYAFTEEALQINRDYYGFPAHLANKQDSILFVDAMICKELGLETAFEGNRFHDLMRFAIRKNDNAFLANWVGRRNPALTGVLMNPDSWFLPATE